MSIGSIFRSITFLITAIKLFLVNLKKKELIDAKNESLDKGDQRAFENSLNPNSSSDNLSVPNTKFPGMYERTVKNKD